MFNHFHCKVIKYDKYFSQSPNCSDNPYQPLSNPMGDFNIELYGDKSQGRAIHSH